MRKTGPETDSSVENIDFSSNSARARSSGSHCQSNFNSSNNITTTNTSTSTSCSQSTADNNSEIEVFRGRDRSEVAAVEEVNGSIGVSRSSNNSVANSSSNISAGLQLCVSSVSGQNLNNHTNSHREGNQRSQNQNGAQENTGLKSTSEIQKSCLSSAAATNNSHNSNPNKSSAPAPASNSKFKSKFTMFDNAPNPNLDDDDKFRVAFQTRMGEQVVRMTSTLVETVSINYEDFNESFLTCGTCLCTYDGGEHNPKLLPCSHTVCLQCLGRIAASAAPQSTLTTLSSTSSTSSGSGSNNNNNLASTPRETPATFRCPICRELINVPRGGVSALPPSFLVNQLLDLMASQRREVIPKCSTHSNQELLFCETCDSVFCAVCVTTPHTSVQAGDHTVIPFSIAIKRMSEILLYKANECLSKLDEATESVTDEVNRLETSANDACEVANQAFEDAVQLLEKRRQIYVNRIRDVASNKREKLMEQLELINKERVQVRDTCEGLEYQVEVRHITKRISELSSQLDSFISLRHPRENAHLLCKTECDLPALETAIATTIRTSTTFPPLCTLSCSPDSLLCAGVEVEVVLETRDYHDQLRKEGGDPIAASITSPKGHKLSSKNEKDRITIEDNEDGTYSIKFTPLEVGNYKVGAEIFGRAIREELFSLDIAEHNNPVKIWGKDELCQPVSVVRGKDGEIFVLDTGNARVVVLDNGISLKRVLTNEALEGRSCTGISYCPLTDSIVIVNWRSKLVTRMSSRDGSTIGTIGWAEFEEPVGISADTKGNIYVADNGARTIFIFDAKGVHKRSIKRDNFGLLGGVAIGPDGKTVIVADMSLFIIGESVVSGSGAAAGQQYPIIEKEIKVPGKGRFGGVVVDEEGVIIATRTEKTRSFVQIFKENKLVSTIDSYSSKLKRPSDLAIISHRDILVVDLGNDCVKQYRYK